MWILLTRHVQDTSQQGEFVSLQVHIQDSAAMVSSDVQRLASQVSFISHPVNTTLIELDIGNLHEQPTHTREPPAHPFPLPSTTHESLQVRTRVPPSSEFVTLALLAAYEGSSPAELGFTAAVYSHVPLSWQKRAPLPFTQKARAPLSSGQ